MAGHVSGYSGGRGGFITSVPAMPTPERKHNTTYPNGYQSRLALNSAQVGLAKQRAVLPARIYGRPYAQRLLPPQPRRRVR